MRVTAAILVVLSLVGLTFLGRIEVAESHVELLPEVAIAASRLPAYQIAFAEAGLDDYLIEKQRIFIPQSKKKNYITALATAELLPAESGQIIGRALNASSPFENRQQRDKHHDNDDMRNARIVLKMPERGNWHKI